MELHISTKIGDYGHPGQSGTDDQAAALALMAIWATRTGRMLRPVPVSELSAEELMAFWADDQIEDSPAADSGRHEPNQHSDDSSRK